MKPVESVKYQRSEKSLSTLTKKFVEMLQAENVLDLNAVNKNYLFSISLNKLYLDIPGD